MEIQFEGPSICVTKCQRGGEEEWGGCLRATLIHVSAGQIIYHLVQTNAVLSSPSEGEEGGVWGPWGLPAMLQPDPHHSSSYLSSLAPLLITPQMQAPGPGDYT